MSIAEAKLLTIDEYCLLPDNGQPTELVRGKVIEMNMPKPRHGQICGKVDRSYGNFAEQHDLGHVLTNDSGVITQRDPDTLRGADVAFYSYSRVPRGPLPDTYLGVAPELVFEVLSPDDRWSKVIAKVAEYLDVGVSVVCVLDPRQHTAHVCRADQPIEVFNADDELTLPEFSPAFRVQIRNFFD